MAPRKRKAKAEKPQKAAKIATECENPSVEAAVSECVTSCERDDSSDESNWEEVEDAKESDSEREPIIPKDGVEITIEPSKEMTKRKRKGFDLGEYFQKQFRRMRKEVQEAMHKVHLLCLVAHGLYVNRSVESDDVLRGFALSIVPIKFLDRTKIDLDDLERIMVWSRDAFATVAQTDSECPFTAHKLRLAIENKSVSTDFQFVLVLSIVLRTLRLETRVISSLQPVPFTVSNERKEKTVKESDEKSSDLVKNESKRKKPSPKNVRSIKKTKKVKENVKEVPRRRSLRRSASRNANLKENDESDEDRTSVKETDDSVSNSDADFDVSEHLSSPGTSKDSLKQTSASKVTNDHWIEVYLESENRWVCVDCVNGIIDRPHEIEKFATQPIRYVIAIDGEDYVKDVTKRYASRWLSQTRKVRIDSEWWNEALDPFRPPISKKEESENRLLDKDLEERPLPTSISEYKSHPLYALKRHLLKFEGIYPSDAVPVGFIRGEPVYPRHCIRALHSRETWLRDARLVKLGETPYKVVKARPKWNKAMGEFQTDLPLELFGEWQTDDYIPPIAHEGKVPRNDYGNVELFKPTMLPQGTVHLQIPGLNRVARKLNIDCAPAMIGWDFHGVGSHPTFDGWIVCEEFKEVLLDAWNEEQILIEKREKEKREKRIYGNWRRLIKGVLIRERLNNKYGRVDEPSTSKDEKQTKEKLNY